VIQPLLAGYVDAGDACHVASSQPCRCLWRGLGQMTCTRPWRRITLHFSQILLTLGRTFIAIPSFVAIGDATPAEVVGRELDLHTITREDADVMHAHLAGDVGQDLVPVLQFDTEHRVGEGFGHRPLQDDRIFLGFRQDVLLHAYWSWPKTRWNSRLRREPTEHASAQDVRGKLRARSAEHRKPELAGLWSRLRVTVAHGGGATAVPAR